MIQQISEELLFVNLSAFWASE